MLEYRAPKIITCLVASIAGGFSMFMMAVLMKFVYSMQTSGNINEADFVGKQAIVYISIPEKGKGVGKINFTVGTRNEDRQAISNSDSISIGTVVKTVSYNNNIFTIERV